VSDLDRVLGVSPGDDDWEQEALRDYYEQPGGLSRVDYLRDRLADSAALDKLPDPEPLIDGILYRNSLAWLHGKPAAGKSFVALDWAACVAAGLPWQERETFPGPVLYVIAEGSTGMGRRKRAWEEQAGERMAVTFLPVPVQLRQLPDVHALAVIAVEMRPVLVVFDTQARVTVGLEENSARDMGLLVDAAEQLRACCGACVLFVHHEPRSGENLRGSTALEGAAMTEIRASRDGAHITLANLKQKEAEEFAPVHLTLRPRCESAVIAANDLGSSSLPGSQDAILSCWRDTFGAEIAITMRAVIDACGLPERTCYRAVKHLVMGGFVANVGTVKRPQYRLVESP
jgi:AAA domain